MGKAKFDRSPFEIPKLPPGVFQAGACAMVHTTKKSIHKWTTAHQVRESIAEIRRGKRSNWVEFTLSEIDKSTVHFHFDVYRKKPNASGPETSLGEILRTAGEFITMADAEEAFVMAIAGMRTKRGEIPENGMVARLLRIDQTVAGAEFTLASAGLEIKDEWFDRLRFSYDEDEGTVTSHLVGSGGPISLHEHYLEEIFELLAVGFDCFIFERASRDRNHEKTGISEVANAPEG